MIRIFDEYQDPIKFESFNFPAGEKHVKLELIRKSDIGKVKAFVEYDFDSNESIIELLLVCDALQRSGYRLHWLLMKYCPFARQDRVMVNGEPLSIKVFSNLINSLEFEKVCVFDPHSEVTPALLNNCQVVHQSEVFSPLLKYKKDFWLVSIDGGSLKKIYDLAGKVNNCLGVIECSKHRDVKTGKITGCHVPDVPFLEEEKHDLVVVDDICDGGKSFVELAKEIGNKWSRADAKLILMVTHGLFTKGLDELSIYYDEIYTKDGKIK